MKFDLSSEINESKSNKITRSYYTVISSLFPPNSIESFRLMNLIDLVVTVYSFLQISSLSWSPEVPVPGSENSQGLWNKIGYLRLDQLFKSLGNLDLFFYSLVSSIISVALFFYILLILAYANKTCSILPVFISNVIRLLCNLFIVPYLNLFLCILKYCFNGTISLEIEGFVIDTNKICLGALSGVLLVFINIFYIIYKFDCRHLCCKGKINPKADILSTVVMQLSIILHVLVLPSYSLLSYALNSATNAGCALFYVILLPNYSNFNNFLKIGFHSSLSLFQVFIIVSYLCSNSQFTAFGLFIVIPFHLVIINYIIEHRTEAISTYSINQCSNYYEFELVLRKTLKSAVPSQEILGQIYDFIKKNDYKYPDVLCVWEAYYCLDVLANERLALIKLNRYMNSQSTIGGFLQVFRCLQIIGDVSLKYEDMSKVRYITELCSIQKYEKNLYNSLTAWIKTFYGDKTRPRELVKLSDSVSSIITCLEQKYNSFIKTFPQSLIDLQSYWFFLSYILCQDEKAKEFKIKTNYLIKNSIKNSKDHETGIFIISANPKTIGDIIYMSDNCKEILEAIDHMPTGSNLSYYVPKPFDKQHNIFLLRHSQSCSDTSIDIPTSFSILNEIGFLIEVRMAVSICYTPTGNVYLLKINKMNLNRHIAMVSPEGTIFNHSELFAYFLGLPYKNIESSQISILLPDLDFDDLKSRKMLIYKLKRIEICLLYIEVYFKSYIVEFIIITEDIREMRRKSSSKSFDKDVFFINIEKANDEEFCNLDDEEVCNLDDEEVCNLDDDVGNFNGGNVSNLNENQISLNKVSEVKSGNVSNEDKASDFNNQESQNLDQAGKFSEYAQKVLDYQVLNKNIVESNATSYSPMKKLLNPSADSFLIEEKATNLKSTFNKSLSGLYSLNEDTKLKQVQNILRVIKYGVIFTLLLVMIIEIVLTILLNYAIYRYDYNQISDTLGNMIYLISTLATNSRAIQFGMITGYSDSHQVLVEYFNSSYQSLETRQQEFSMSESVYQVCPGTKLLFEDTIPIFNPNTGEFQDHNLINALDLYLETVIHKQSSNFLKNSYNLNQTIESSEFLVQNGYGVLIPYLNQTIYKSFECSYNQTRNIITLSYAIYFLEIGLLVLAALFLLNFCWKKHLLNKKIWKILKNLIKNNSKAFIEVCKKNVKKIETGSFPTLLESNEIGKWHFFNISTRICVFFIIFFIFLIATLLQINEEILGILDMIPIVSSNLLIRNLLYQHIYFYCIESYNNNLPLRKFTSFSEYHILPVSNPDSIVLSSTMLKYYFNIIHSPTVISFLPSSAIEMQFYYINDSDTAFFQGSIVNGKLVYQDMLYFSKYTGTDHYDLLYKTYTRIIKIGAYLNQVTDLCGNHFSYMLSNTFAIIVILKVFMFVIASVFGYFFIINYLKTREIQVKNLFQMCLILTRAVVDE